MGTETLHQSREVQTVGEVVARDYRAADVFEKHGIDFCCGGQVSLAQACQEKGIELATLLKEIEELAQEAVDRSQNYGAWELPFLAEYIVNTHHAYLRENIDSIAAYTQKIAQVHGAGHPEVIKIARIFYKIAADLKQHLIEEEQQLFPAIRKIVELKKAGGAEEAGQLEALRSSLAALTHDHDEIGAAIHAIRALAEDYRVPPDVCNTFAVTYQKLKEFEDDLHKHVHLENNILFLKAALL
jgi:regulator of cell morphogenesis and NO signaling